MSELISSLKEATRLIARKGSRVKMIVAGILMVFTLVMPMLVSVYTTIAIFGMTWSDTFIEYFVMYGIFVFISLFVTLPSAAMLATYAKQVYSEAKYGYADIKVRGAYNYFRCLFASLRLFFLPIVATVLIQAEFYATLILDDLAKENGVPHSILFTFLAFSIIIILAVAFVMWLRSSHFLTLNFFCGGNSVSRSNKLSKKGTARHPFYSDLFALLLAVLFLVSLPTFCVLLVLWVAPLMMFTYFELAERMTAVQTEE